MFVAFFPQHVYAPEFFKIIYKYVYANVNSLHSNEIELSTNVGEKKPKK